MNSEAEKPLVRKNDRKMSANWAEAMLAVLVIILVVGIGYVVLMFWAFLGGGLFR